VKYLLLPFSWIYGLVIWIRNLLFDLGVFKQIEFPIPIICIGNLSVGGTGKSPHTIYLAELLR
jgi:tetraacyldisaccharide 4'-kinase